ncbi:winged helix-turn-helix transcriptional regulator [Streptomyces sp. NBC_00343]|uniref:winged helix-turn-helix transcriptional regulator n=1 Tax=Streptomyces sp. NBC_00343 TaxID=2975719 RepID=UPI002E2D19DA|nr:winged helix-turn-helix transcriptional regulator [Streptomyces sp. NBC_00343]
MKPQKRETLLSYPVKEHGTFLATRAKGAETRQALEGQLVDAVPIALLIIDFGGVEAMTNSFVDEFLGKFYLLLAAGDIHADGVRLAGLDEETREGVTVCLERRKQIAVDGDTYELLGDAALLTDTYAQARQLGDFRAAQLAEALGISLPNANNRLKKLVEAGALYRERASGPDRGGKEYTYRQPRSGARD